MRVIALGERAFVSGLRLAGVEGIEVASSKEAAKMVKHLVQEKGIGLIILSDTVGRDLRGQIAELLVKQPIPLIYEVPSPTSKVQKIDYRDLIKRLLKIG